MQGLTQTQALFAGAEAAYQAQNWLDAVRLYEAVRAQSADYQAAVVSQHAAQAYLQAAQTIVSRRPVNITDPELARTYFRKAGDADRAAADAGLAQIDAFTQGQPRPTGGQHEPGDQPVAGHLCRTVRLSGRLSRRPALSGLSGSGRQGPCRKAAGGCIEFVPSRRGVAGT